MARRRFQNGTVYLKGMKNPAWVGRWREDVVIDGKVCRKYRNTVIGYKRDLPTKKLALRELASRLAHVNSPTYRPLRAATFREFSDKWKREILTTMKPSTQLAISSQLRNSLGYFASCKLADIGLSTLQTYVASLTCSPKTARNLVMTLRSMWNTASKQGYVSHDPFDGLVLPRLVKLEQPFFTDDEMRRIIDAAEEPYKTFYWLAAETGMRAGELCGLQWGDVHEGYVQVRRAVERQYRHAENRGKCTMFRYQSRSGR